MNSASFASPTASPRERHSVWWMNLALLAMAIFMSWLFGVAAYLLLQTVAWMVAGATGIWLAYWERGDRWDYTAAALKGSSYYKLPRVLQWISGNIGFHHIHHLSPQIPNYNLESCHEADPIFRQVMPITLLSSLKSLRFRFWDEPAKKLVGYRRMRQLRKEQKP